MLNLVQLGDRICIIGPSNSGKSTLAQKLAARNNQFVFHLDQLAHFPHSNWARLPDHQFVEAHDKILDLDDWIIDGNYSICMPQRFKRATSVIWLDPPLPGCIARYLGRCLMSGTERPGNLTGSKSEFSFSLIRHTLINYPKNRLKYAKLLEPHFFPILHIRSMKELSQYDLCWGL